MSARSLSPRRFAPSRVFAWLLVLSFLVPGGFVLPQKARAENRIQAILKDALYGGAAGLLLGGMVALVNDDDWGAKLRWGVAIGTFAGFAYGIYETRGDSGGYSGLVPSRSNGLGGSPADGRLDPAFAAWAEKAWTAQGGGRTLVASLVRTPSTPGSGRAPGAADSYRR